jgi:uncharacterized protein
MSRENVDLVRRAYDMFAEGDLHSIAALFAEDAKLAGGGGLGVTGTTEGTRTGPLGFIRAVEEVLEAFDDYTVRAENFIDVGDTVVVEVVISGTGRGSGMEIETRLAHLWGLRDGMVVRGEVFRTTKEAVAAAGG